MHRFILATAVLASLAAPLAAQAYPGELQDDRRDIRHESRDLDRARHDGDRRDIHEQRGDLRDARQEYREDLSDRHDGHRYDDRRDGRNDHRRAEWRADRRYDAGRYYYPRGHAYRAWSVGGYIPRAYWGERYWVRPASYGLPWAAGGTRWLRVGPDAVLIRQYDGSVVRVVRGIFY